jgi:small subunit ribosomal protein S11
MAEEVSTTEEEAKPAEAPVTDVSAKIKGGKKKKAKAKFTKGRVYITATYNNTIISVADQAGNILAWGSSGRTGFKGSKKSTPYAGQRTMEDLLSRIKDRGLVEVDVLVKGVGSGRESAIRALQGSGMNVLTIKDETPTAHGGVRQKKVRRI